MKKQFLCLQMYCEQTIFRESTMYPSVSKAAIIIACFVSVLLVSANAHAQVRFSKSLLKKSDDWYRSDEAKRIADAVIQYQSPQGGWPKSTEIGKAPRSPKEVPQPGDKRANSLDNDATTVPIEFLARIVHVTGTNEYRKAVRRGLDYLFDAQYSNGGWPQFWPLRKGYYSQITYNDNAMVRVLEIIKDVAEGNDPYQFVDESRRERAKRALARGIQCVLKTQIRQDNELTAWCAQHDAETLEPAWARAYEPPSISGGESVGIVRFLMTIDQPSDEVIAAIEGAVEWLRSVSMSDVRIVQQKNDEGKRDRMLVRDTKAPRLWARFYELKTNRPLYLDRDSVFRYDFSEIGYERRNGYSYHGTWAESLLEKDYPRWRNKYISN